MPVRPTSRTAVAATCFAIVYLVWGSSYLATSIGVKSLPPFLFGGVRFMLGGLLLAAIALALGRKLAVARPEWQHLLIVALGSVLISNGTNAWSMQWVASNQSALLNATAALWIALLATRGRRAHPLTRATLIGLVLGFAGAALIVWPRGGLAGSQLGLQSVILLGVVGWAAATVYMRNAESQLDVMVFTAWQMLLGGAMLTFVGIVLGEPARWTWSTPGLVAMAYMTIASSCLGYTAYAWLTQNVTPAAVGTYSYVNPAIAALLGWWFLDEHLSWQQLLGMVVMLGGVVIVSWPRRSTPTQAAV
jgi:drug/metabolite transporter (DMT)-like permease